MDDIDSLLEKLGGHLCNLDEANGTYSSWIGEVMELSNCEAVKIDQTCQLKSLRS